MSDLGSARSRRDTRPKTGRRWPIVAVVAIALLGAVAIDRVGLGDVATPTSALAIPMIPSADAVSSAWYCAEGSSTPGNGAEETLVITNLGGGPARATVTVMPGSGQEPVARDLALSARSQTRVRVADVLSTPQPGVLVETFGGPVVVEHELVANGDFAVGACATAPSGEWHFASGTTGKGAALSLALFNPFGDDAIVDVGLLTDGGFAGPGELQAVVVPRRSRISVPISDSVRRQSSVATQVRARRGRVVAEQSLLLDGTDGRKGFAVSLGAPALASRAFFPIRSSLADAADLVTLANPGPSPVQVTVETRLDGDATLAPQTVVIPSRATGAVDLGPRVPAGVGAWVEIDAHGSGVVAEQLLARSRPAAIALSLGITQPATRWALAAARTTPDATDVVVIANPGRTAARASVRVVGQGRDTALDGAGALRIAPGRRVVVDLAALGVPYDAGLLVEADRPVALAREGGSAAGLTESPAIPGR